MPKQFDSVMGAVRIFSKGEQVHHRGDALEVTPPDWKPIKACQYVRRTGFFSRAKTSLDEVVRDGILDDETPVLIIVHMCKDNYDPETLDRQVRVIEAAKGKNIPIYETQRVNRLDKNTPGLTRKLREAVGNYTQFFYYDGELGNALEGVNKKGWMLREIIEDSRADVAIVFGQEYGQCVDSTILGMYDKRPIPPGSNQPKNPYSEGLLDIGIDVVTARDVLLPPPNQNAINSPYFSFDMGENIVLSSPSREPAPAQGGSTRSSVLQAPTSFADQSATKAATDV